MDNNPSPGNKAGGLTTILEKSLGAVAKGGTTNLRGCVSSTPKPVTGKGLRLHGHPGLRPGQSATGQVAGGANLVCFTTGRGSAYGCKPSRLRSSWPPTRRCTSAMTEDMDINCGEIVDGSGDRLQQKGQEIFEMILAGLHPASRARARRWVSARRNSCRGIWVR